MLTRFRFRRDYRLFSRCLSDKPSDGEGKHPEEPNKVEKKSKNDLVKSTEKIQALLNNIMTAPKISESEYRERFTVAPDRRRKLEHDEIEVTTEKIDKPSDGEGKHPEEPNKVEKKSKNDLVKSTEKIQALLNNIMTAPKISESEYRERFTVAPDRRRKLEHDEIEVTTEKIEESITKAAGDVAQAIGGDVKQTEVELLSRVLGKINQTSTNLSDLLIGMKVDRHTKVDETVVPSRGQQVKRNMGAMRENRQKTAGYSQRLDAPAGRRHEQEGWQAGRRMQQEGEAGRRWQQEGEAERRFTKSSPPQLSTVDIFGGQPLGIFSGKQANYGTKLDVWERLKQRELELATAQPPANYFQKMILWTEQGKVWKFPIDNEQGIEEEQNIHFSEHIFLDSHLEDWCPKRGPIRHFMELVCVGLSKNPFYTAKEKKDHILWYKEYFESKKDLLSEVGAWDTKPKSNEAST